MLTFFTLWVTTRVVLNTLQGIFTLKVDESLFFDRELAEKTIKQARTAGLPLEKLTLGVPFYGRWCSHGLNVILIAKLQGQWSGRLGDLWRFDPAAQWPLAWGWQCGEGGDGERKPQREKNHWFQWRGEYEVTHVMMPRLFIIRKLLSGKQNWPLEMALQGWWYGR